MNEPAVYVRMADSWAYLGGVVDVCIEPEQSADVEALDSTIRTAYSVQVLRPRETAAAPNRDTRRNKRPPAWQSPFGPPPRRRG